MAMIWRDDDISKRTKLPQLRQVDDGFQFYNLPHTIAVIVEGLESRPDLLAFIHERRMSVQLHAWDHEDLTTDAAALAAIPRAADTLESLIGIRPTVLYPPWNRSNETVARVAADCGLTVSTAKVSLDQWLRAPGDQTVNFHYWDALEAELLTRALPYARELERVMKTTDYCPRAAPFDVHLRDRRQLVGVEVGVDAGAHAEAMLRHLDILHLYLVDRWPKDYHYGYCEGRLSALGFRPRFTMVQQPSAASIGRFPNETLDFVYCDETRDAETATRNMELWWPKLKSGGLLGYRGYGSGDPLSQALDTWVAKNPTVERRTEPGELILVK